MCRDVNEARTFDSEAEARTLEAEARTLEAKPEAEARTREAKAEAKAEFNQFGLRNYKNFEGHSKKFHENLNVDKFSL